MATDVTTQRIEQAPSEHEDESSWALFVLAWRRKWIVLFLIGVGLGLGYLFYMKQTPVYQSTAKVFIVRDQANGPIDGIDLSDSYDSVHETLIRSPAILEVAIGDLDISSMPSFKDLWVSYEHVAEPEVRERKEHERDLLIARRMLGSLSVEVGSSFSGDILAMSYKSIHAEECKAVLYAVYTAYQSYQKKIYGEESGDAAQMIADLQAILSDDLDEAHSDYKKFRDETKLFFDGESTENTHAKRARELEEELGHLRLKHLKLQLEVGNIEHAIEQGMDDQVLNLMIKRPGSDEVVGPEAPMPDRLFELEKEKKRLTQKYAADHPRVIAVEDEIRLTKQFFEGATTGEEDNFVAAYVASRNFDLKVFEDQIKILDAEYQEEKSQADLLGDAILKGSQLRGDIEILRDAHRAAVDQFRKVNIATKSSNGTQVELIDPPTDGYQVEPVLMTIMIASGLLGMLAGLGLAYAVDRADRRFHSPDEIRSDLGIPVVGHIPVLPGIKRGRRNKEQDTQPGELSTALRTFYHPRGRIAEAYRAVRTALYFSTQGSGHQVIQVTSPSPGDGKSTLSGNLALSIANSGKRALLIDADFRRPRIHRLFGLDNSQGISSVIEGKAEIADAVQQTEVENLSIMSCGPRPDNPSELLSSKRFAELLDLLREQYDLVIVDTPPVLAVTDPLNVVPRVDGVLVVLRLTKNARTMGRRALEALDGMGAKVCGIVINGVASQGGGYGYGNSYGKYGYGYGRKGGYGGYRYGYGAEYGYQYQYGDGDDQTYYDEDVALPARNTTNGASQESVAQAK